MLWLVLSIAGAYRMELEKKEGPMLRPMHRELPGHGRELGVANSTQTNGFNNLYTGILKVGAGETPMRMVMDTGSSWLWVGVNGCTGCPGATIDPSADADTTLGSTPEQIIYGSGNVTGVQMTTSYKLETLADPSILTIGVQTANGMSGSSFDAIMGMAPRPQGSGTNAQLVVDQLKAAGSLSSRTFGVMFKLTNETSWIDFGTLDSSIVTSSDVIHWEDLFDTNYWTIEMRQMEYGHEKLSITSGIDRALVDTGSSLIHTDSNSFNKLMNEITAHMPSGDCLFNNILGTYYGCYCDASGIDMFKNITFHGKKWQLDVIPEQYVTPLPWAGGRTMCIFRILPSSGSFYGRYILLGDSFIRNYYIVHDPDNLRIGFVPFDGRTIRESNLSEGLTLLEILLIVAFSAIACLCFCIGMIACAILCFYGIKWMTAKPKPPMARPPQAGQPVIY